MWILTDNETSPGTIHHLLCNRDILVGRKTDIKLENDKSISRTHAQIHINYESKHVQKDAVSGEVSLCDVSKYGTFVNGEQLERERALTIGDGTVIRFGLQWNTWTLRWRPLVVTTSLLSRDQRDLLTSTLTDLGATCLPQWTPTVTHLVMATFKLSAKAVLALASGVPIVTPAYLDTTRDSIAASSTTPELDPSDFTPEFDEPMLNGNDYSLAVDAERSKLFIGKQFIFSDPDHFSQLSAAVELAGGSAHLLSQCGLTDSELTRLEVIVVDGSTPSQQLDRIKAQLKRRKRRAVQFQEIGLAVLRKSTERDCNPAFDNKANVLPPLAGTQSQLQQPVGAVLARETQPVEVTPSSVRRREVGQCIPPTPPTPQPSPSAVTTPTTGRTTRGNRLEPPAQTSTSGTLPKTVTSGILPGTGTSGILPGTATSGTPPQADSSSGQGKRGSSDGLWTRTAKRPRVGQGAGGLGEGTQVKEEMEETEFYQESAAVDTEELMPPPSTAVIRQKRPRISTSSEGAAGSVSSTLHSASRVARTEDEDLSSPAFKRPALRSGQSSVPPGEDDFDFELESAPIYQTLPAANRPSRVNDEDEEPMPAPSARPPADPMPSTDRKLVTDRTLPDPDRKPAPWISKTAPPVNKTEPQQQVKCEPLGDVTNPLSDVIEGCMRLELTSLVVRHEPTERESASGDDQSRPNFKRFRRVRAPAVCPRIIGGSDLFSGPPPASRLFPGNHGNGEAPAGSRTNSIEDVTQRWRALTEADRRQDAEEDAIWRQMESLSTAGRQRRR